MNPVAKALDQQIKRFKSHAYRSERRRLVGRSAPPEMEAPLPETVNSTVPGGDGMTIMDGVFPDGQVDRLKEFDMEPHQCRWGGRPDAISGS